MSKTGTLTSLLACQMLESALGRDQMQWTFGTSRFIVIFHTRLYQHFSHSAISIVQSFSLMQILHVETGSYERGLGKMDKIPKTTDQLKKSQAIQVIAALLDAGENIPKGITSSDRECMQCS